MKAVIVQFIIAGLLFAAAPRCWTEARTARRVADAYARLATLRYDVDDRIGETASLLDRVPLPIADARDRRPSPPHHRAYWRSEFGPLTVAARGGRTAGGDHGPVADAHRAPTPAFRSALSRLGDTAILERLDGIIHAYGDVLRADPTLADASFNYELRGARFAIAWPRCGRGTGRRRACSRTMARC